MFDGENLGNKQKGKLFSRVEGKKVLMQLLAGISSFHSFHDENDDDDDDGVNNDSFHSIKGIFKSIQLHASTTDSDEMKENEMKASKKKVAS